MQSANSKVEGSENRTYCICLYDVCIYFTSAADTNETCYFSWSCNGKHSELHSLLFESSLNLREGDKIQCTHLSQFVTAMHCVRDKKNCLIVQMCICVQYMYVYIYNHKTAVEVKFKGLSVQCFLAQTGMRGLM